MSDCGLTPKQAINRLLREALTAPKKSGAPVTFKPVIHLGEGLQAGFDWDMSNAELLDRLDELESDNDSD